jgi:hypothetical protein
MKALAPGEKLQALKVPELSLKVDDLLVTRK